MKLDLPFDYDLESKIFTMPDTFVVISRDDSATPFVCYTIGTPDRRLIQINKVPCFHGHYSKTREGAVKEMYRRAMRCLG